MAFTFSSTAGTSGETSITVSATPNLQTVSIVEYYTLSNTSGNSVSMPIVQMANKPVEKYINLKPSSFEVMPKPTSSSIQISSNDNWHIVSSSWIKLSNQFDKGVDTKSKAVVIDIFEPDEKLNHLYGSGNTIVGISFAENSGETRTGFISGNCMSDTAVTAYTSVVQIGAGANPYITVSPETIFDLPASGLSSSITVTSNIAWTAYTEEKWVHITGAYESSGNGTVNYTVDENNDGYSRSGGIKVVNDKQNIAAYFYIKQMANGKDYIFLEPDVFKVDASGSTGNSISVSSNCEYDISTDVGWIRLGSVSGSGNTVVYFDTDSGQKVNTDIGNITFYNKSISSSVAVSRYGTEKYISASTSQISSVYDSSAVNIVNVYSNVEWSVIVNGGTERWLSASPVSGKGDGVISITINSSTTLHTGSVILQNVEYGLKLEIDVVQKYPNNVLVYTTTDNQIINFSNRSIGNGNSSLPISNTYENGIGKAVYDAPITHIGLLSSGNYTGFNNATTLRSIEIPDTVTVIGFGAFLNCPNLTELTIPSGVTSIGTYAFSGRGLTTLYWNASQCTTYRYEPYYYDIKRPFNYAWDLTDVICGDNVSTLPEYFLYGAGALQRVRISPNTTVLPYMAFLQTGIKDFVLPDQIEEIQPAVFSASSLTAFTINSGTSLITANGISPHLNVVYLNLKTNSLPANIVNCFDDTECLYIDMETIPESYFYNSDIPELHLSENVKTISNRFFYSANSLTNIYSHSRTAPVLDGETTFYYTGDKERTIHYPAGSDYSSWEEFHNLTYKATFIADL